MKIEEIQGGKCLKALSKETKAQIGQAFRVEFATERGAQKLWAIEFEGRFADLVRTWDDCARFFRDKGCIVKIADDCGDEDQVDGKPRAEREVTLSKRLITPKPERELMRSPQATKKRGLVPA